MTIQARRKQIERSTAGAYPKPYDGPPPLRMPGTAAELGARLAAIPGDVTVEWLREILRRSDVADKDEAEFLSAYYGSPPCVHFVGFKGDEYTRAVRVFGRPDFIHRKNDIRLQRGGELHPSDIIVYANGCERAVMLDAVDDSNIDVQAYEKAMEGGK